MKNYKYIIGLFTILLAYNCTSVSEEDLIDNTPPPNSVSFNEDVRIIMENNCTFCHGDPPTNGATTPLVTYQNVVDGVNNNNLIQRISAQPGEGGAMPLGGPRLPQNLIDLIIEWEAQGFIDDTPPPPPITFDDDIKIIMDNNCTFCHGNPPTNGATTPLVTYQNVVDGVNNNNLIQRISAQPGEGGAMPLGGPRLPQNLIDLVAEWQAQGFIEN